MDSAWLTLANAPLKAQRSLWDPRLLWATLVFIGLVLAGVLVIFLVRRWQQQADESECPTANEQLATFRELYDQGAMSQEEFDRVRALLSDRLREEMNVPAAPAPEVSRDGSAASPPPPTNPSTTGDP